MINVNDFANNFNGQSIPQELAMLLDFQNNTSHSQFYAAGFELTVTGEKYGLQTYSTDKVFLNALLEFANADGTGSTYAIWLKDSTQNLSELPIVVFGSEGGFHVVANNSIELLEILAYDAAPSAGWDAVHYYKDTTDYQPSQQHPAYKKWLAENFTIMEISNANDIVAKAQAAQQEAFKQWMKNYYAG